MPCGCRFVMMGWKIGLVNDFGWLPFIFLPRLAPHAQSLFVAMTAVFHQSLIAVDADIASMSTQCTMKRFHYRPVVHSTNNDSAGVAAFHVHCLGWIIEVVGHYEPIHLHRTGVRDVHHRCNGVGAIISGGCPIPPVVGSTTSSKFDFSRIWMHIFPFTVLEFANPPCFVQAMHLLIINHIRIIFGE